jgi:Type I restriction enzyme R protein N terminus (HSDR_N)
MLGYTASGPNRIIRSRPLEHPFVRIGTRKHTIRIIPDYLLQQDGENAWILDAKAPGQTITVGDNVEQAYSYAIHKSIRVPLYALCNGRELIIFHISEEEPLFHEPLSSLRDEETWKHLLFYLGTRSAMPHGIPLGFRLDYGLHVGKSGVHTGTKKVVYAFQSVPIGSVAKVDDSLYCANANYGEDGYEFMITFDFGPAVLPQLLQSLPAPAAEQIDKALKQQPYQIAYAQERVRL